MPVYDGGQIHETALDRDIGDIAAPNLVGTGSDDLPLFIFRCLQEIGVDFMLLSVKHNLKMYRRAE
jgi:hypothetical protein